MDFKKNEEEIPPESTKSSKSIKFCEDDDDPDGFFDVSIGKIISRDDFLLQTHHKRAFLKNRKEEDDSL
jgi:hypothetical protein